MNTQAIRCYIGLGSNLNNPVQQIHSAFKSICTIADTQIVACSHLYRNPAFYPPAQPEYINAVIAIDTQLTAHHLLKELQKIEKSHGRTRDTVRFGPRTLDLDLLLYGDMTISTPKLIIPHPGLITRHFVLYPLAEIAPDLRLPSGELLANVLTKIPATGLERIN